MTAPTPIPNGAAGGVNAGIRKIFYLLSGVIAAVMPLLYSNGIIDAQQATLGGLVGGGGALAAAAVTHKQQRDGLHDAPPDPLEQIAQAQQIILSNETDAVSKAEALRQLMSGVLAPAPDFPVPPVSLAQQALDSIIPQ